MKLVRSVVFLGLVLAPLALSAADIPVQFTTKEKDLKSALAGTPLTFALYGDAACTNQVYSAVINVENVALITKMKQFTPKNDVKLPNTVALQTTLPGVTAHGNLFLKVTGVGIVPVAGACQAQAATVPAPTCTDGLQNQGEADTDCGGGVCPNCPVGSTCTQNSDCSSLNCVGGMCQPPVNPCTNGMQDGDESDVDCGGLSCPGCPPGATCFHNSDCLSNSCIANECQ
jgi:hypothetical protein